MLVISTVVIITIIVITLTTGIILAWPLLNAFVASVWTSLTVDHDEETEDQQYHDEIQPDDHLTLSSDNTCTSTKPIFDIDDLSFLRTHGLGLRHVELELGIKQAREGAARGDAVSLANYGVDGRNHAFSVKLCAEFEDKVRAFIKLCFTEYHAPESHYNAAAFMLIRKDNASREPYDFHNYPLGKCGSLGFSAEQVVRMIKTDSHINEDREQAVHNVVSNLKDIVQQLKLEAILNITRTLGSESALTEDQKQRLQGILASITSHYNQGTYIGSDLFLRLSRITLAAPRCFFLEEQATHQQIQTQIDSIQADLDSLDNTKKSNPVYKSPYPGLETHDLSTDELKEVLLHYIKNQILSKVTTCLAQLPTNAFLADDKNPLQLAASYGDTAILKAVYEHNPELYNQACTPSPLYLSIYAIHTNNCTFLLSKKVFQPDDLCTTHNGMLTHVFSRLLYSQQGHDLLKLMIDLGAPVGNDLHEMNANPLANCIFSRENFRQKNLALMLPVADHHSKYWAILRSITELYYSYGTPDSAAYVGQLQAFLRTILNTLTEDECDAIEILYVKGTGLDDIIKKSLPVILLNHELKIAKQTGNQQLVSTILRAFNHGQEPKYIPSYSRQVLLNMLEQCEGNFYLEQALAEDIPTEESAINKAAETLAFPGINDAFCVLFSNLTREKPEHLNITYLRMQDVLFSLAIHKLEHMPWEQRKTYQTPEAYIREHKFSIFCSEPPDNSVNASDFARDQVLY